MLYKKTTTGLFTIFETEPICKKIPNVTLHLRCSKRILVIFILTQFIIAGLFAQDQQNTLVKNVKQIDTDIKKVTDVFKRKDKTPEKKPAPENVNSGTLKSPIGGIEPGDISPSAKYVDFDFVDPFYNGVAIVRKGSASGLIDKNGNFIIPYNKYTISYQDEVNGFISISNELGYVSIINPGGKILYDYKETQSSSRISQEIGSCIEVTYHNKKTFTYIDSSGKRYIHTEKLTGISDGIGIVMITLSDHSTLNKYKTLNGKYINNDSYNEAYPFSDDMALVGKQDEFGEMKYGYINSEGKQIVPVRYSLKPSKFFNGFAIVKAKDKSVAAYAVINKKGEIVFQKSQAEYNKSGEQSLFFKKNIAIAGRYILDSTGKVVTHEAFLLNYGIKNFENLNLYAQKAGITNEKEHEDENILWYIGQDKKFTGYGFINIEKNKFTPPIFFGQPFFDPISKLAFTKVFLGRDANNRDVWREGFINEEGIFVLLKKQGDKW